MSRTEIREGSRSAGERGGRGFRGGLAGLSLCTLLPAMGISIANVALPEIGRELGVPLQAVQWVVLAYLLATTTLVVGAGRLGDMVGRRRLLMAGIGLYTMASVACALAPTLGWLVAARAGQGMGAAVLMALAMSLVGETVPADRAGRAMGLLGSMSAAGTALGPSLGGVLATRHGWQAVFAVQVPLALLAWALVACHVPASRPVAGTSGGRRAGFDGVGTLLLAATLGAYAMAMTVGRGGFGAVNAMLLLAAALGAWAFTRVEARVDQPLVRLAGLREPGLRAALAMGAIVSTVVMATLVVGPYYLAQGLGLATAQVGIAMSVGPAVAALAGLPAGQLVDRFGAGRMVVAGLGAMVLGSGLLCLAPIGLGPAGYVLPLAVLTAGYALFQAANNTATMAGVPATERGVVSGLLNLSRNLGLVTGASAMAALYALAVGSAAPGASVAQAAEVGMRATFAVAALLLAVASCWALRRWRGRS